MAVGYSHVGTVRALLAAGASPEVPDNQGRNVIQLVDSIRDQLPLNPQMAGKRIALEEVSALLTGKLSTCSGLFFSGLFLSRRDDLSCISLTTRQRSQMLLRA